MIEIQDVSKTFRTARGDTAAVTGVGLSVRRGEVFGVIGPSGAGKSTLIRLINRLETPDSGRVVVDGEDVTAMSPERLRAHRRRVGMIFQHFGLLSSRTAAGNVAFPLELAGELSAGEIRTRTAEALKRVGLSEHARKYPAQLSGGQKQRVGVARALATGPDILLCDEATSALDPESTRSLLTLIADLNRELGLTVVLISHEMDVIRRVCDRVAVLDAGRVVESGTVADVFLAPSHATTRQLVREADLSDTEETARAEAAGRKLYRLTLRGEAAAQPVLARLAREEGVDFSVVSGRISRIKDTPYAQMTVAFEGPGVEAALKALNRDGVTLEAL